MFVSCFSYVPVEYTSTSVCGFWGRSLRPHRGSVPEPRWGTSVRQTLLTTPPHENFKFGVKNLTGSRLVAVTAHAQKNGQNGLKPGQIGKNSAFIRYRARKTYFGDIFLDRYNYGHFYGAVKINL